MSVTLQTPGSPKPGVFMFSFLVCLFLKGSFLIDKIYTFPRFQVVIHPLFLGNVMFFIDTYPKIRFNIILENCL